MGAGWDPSWLYSSGAWLQDVTRPGDYKRELLPCGQVRRLGSRKSWRVGYLSAFSDQVEFRAESRASRVERSKKQ